MSFNCRPSIFAPCRIRYAFTLPESACSSLKQLVQSAGFRLDAIYSKGLPKYFGREAATCTELGSRARGRDTTARGQRPRCHQKKTAPCKEKLLILGMDNSS